MNVRGGGGSGGTSGSGFRLGPCSSPATFSTLQPCLVPTLALAPLLNSILTCPCCLASFTHLSTLRAQFHVPPYSLLSACPCLALALHSTLADLHGPHPRATIFFYPPHHHSLDPPSLYFFVEFTPTFLLLIVKSRRVLA